ncbi:MAG: hypothetical protein ACRCV0_04925 [Brevinema sp.]
MKYPKHTLESLARIKVLLEGNKDNVPSVFALEVSSLFLEIGMDWDEDIVKDTAICLVFVCYVELFELAIVFMNHQTIRKYKKKDLIRYNQKIERMIDKLYDELELYGKDKKDKRYEESLQKELLEYKTELREDLHRIKLDEAITNQKYNFIYSQKFLTNTGVRDLLARMLCVTLQVLFYDEFMKNRFVFIRFIYRILELFVEHDHLEDFGENELYKLIKEIDVKNPDQMFAGTFLEMQKLCLQSHNKYQITIPLMIQWKNLDLSFNQMYDFVNEQTKRFIHSRRLSSDDF